MRWDDKAHLFTIDARRGRFPGMLEKRAMHLVLVREGVGGIDHLDKIDQEIVYDGRPLKITLLLP